VWVLYICNIAIVHVPASITTLLGDTAADNRKPSLSNASRSSNNSLENPSLSLFGPRLQSTCSYYNTSLRCTSTIRQLIIIYYLLYYHDPCGQTVYIIGRRFITCQHFGYSQSKSSPSKSFCFK